ncbi:MAG: hypothetical protein GZ087_00730 [Flavobacterium sp.]|nr:hypothetical protein [Flavobacterium sp.]
MWFTTAYLFVFAGLCLTKIPLLVLMSLLLIGNFLIPLMVYTVLRDPYSTKKTFQDWYEDNPEERLDEEL